MNCDYCKVPLSKDGHCREGCGAPSSLQAKRVVPPFPKNTVTDQYGGTIKEWYDSPQFSDIFALVSFMIVYITCMFFLFH